MDGWMDGLKKEEKCLTPFPHPASPLTQPHHRPPPNYTQNLTTSYSRSTGPAHPLHPAFDIPTYHTQSFAETQQLFSPGVSE